MLVYTSNTECNRNLLLVSEMKHAVSFTCFLQQSIKGEQTCIQDSNPRLHGKDCAFCRDSTEVCPLVCTGYIQTCYIKKPVLINVFSIGAENVSKQPAGETTK